MSKSSVADLAVFGGPAEFSEPLHVGRPNLGDRERLLARLADVIDGRWLTNDGAMVQDLEARLAAMTGARHCIAVCNGTMGLEIAVRAAGLHGEVIVPSLTFVATAHALQWQGITPVFCDVDPKTHTIDPTHVEALITERTTGILGVHLWGRPCEIDELERIATRRGLTLLFDAAHALACTYRTRPIGTFGRAEVLSFHATKFVTATEGGAIVTDDEALAGRARLMRNFGFAGLDRVVSLGTNGKMSEIAAAVGVTNLESIDAFLAANRANYERYRERLDGIAGVALHPLDDLVDRRNFQYVVIETDPDVIARDALVSVLRAENVLARRYFWPGCHRMEPYRSLVPGAGARLRETERISERIVVLPTGTAVTPSAVDRVCDLIRFTVRGREEIQARLRLEGDPG